VTQTTDKAFDWPIDRGDLSEVYREVCAGIRTTDEISLKLLAAVPLASGIGIPLLVGPSSSDPSLSNGARALLSAFAAVVTCAIYVWERRNISTCVHYVKWAAILEKEYFRVPPVPWEPGNPDGAFLPHHPPEPKLAWVQKKRRAEAVLYVTAILAWLSAAGYSLTL
jgi:hypothetical protein